MQARRFDPSQQRQVHRAAARAEDLTAGFYCIPGREWARFPYDIATLSEGPGPEARVFADVVRAVPSPRVPSGWGRDLYRIRLRDDEILAAVAGLPEVGLFPLLLYVLTHELVHVVRFESGLAEFDAPDPGTREREETRVHGITRKILKPDDSAALRRVAELCARAAGGPPATA